MKKIRTLILICLLVAAAAGPACNSNPPSNESSTPQKTIKDDLGNEFRLPEKVTRIVSLAPNLTEIVYAIDAGDSLVGVTTFCDYPVQAKEVKKVGDTLKPNIETIIGLKPQFVLVTTASQLESFSNVLKNQGIEVFVTNPDSVASLFGGIRKIGELLGKDDEASRLVSEIEQRVQKAAESARAAGTSTKAFVQIDKTLYTIGKGSFISDALSKIGYKSVTEDINNPYPKISKERALVLDPDLIIISESVGNDAPSDVFSNSTAVKSGRVYRIDADILSRPGPRFVSALESLIEKEKAWNEGRKN